MSIKKHPKTGIWYVHISRKGKTIRRSAGTKNRDEAQELHDKLASELWRESVLGERKQHKFDDAVVIFRAYAKGSKAPSTKLHHATYWMRFLPVEYWRLSSLTKFFLACRQTSVTRRKIVTCPVLAVFFAGRKPRSHQS